MVDEHGAVGKTPSAQGAPAERGVAWVVGRRRQGGWATVRGGRARDVTTRRIRRAVTNGRTSWFHMGHGVVHDIDIIVILLIRCGDGGWNGSGGGGRGQHGGSVRQKRSPILPPPEGTTQRCVTREHIFVLRAACEVYGLGHGV